MFNLFKQKPLVISTPDDMTDNVIVTSEILEYALREIERKLKREVKSQSLFSINVNVKLNDVSIKTIENIYYDMGWKRVDIHNFGKYFKIWLHKPSTT